MGTLHDQRPRDRHHGDDERWLRRISRLSEESGLEPRDVIAALQVQELYRRNEIHIDDRDAWDEQISGIGKILEQLVEAVQALVDKP